MSYHFNKQHNIKSAYEYDLIAKLVAMFCLASPTLSMLVFNYPCDYKASSKDVPKRDFYTAIAI